MSLRVGLAAEEFGGNLPDFLASSAVLALADDLQVAGLVVEWVAIDVIHHPMASVSDGFFRLAEHCQV